MEGEYVQHDWDDPYHTDPEKMVCQKCWKTVEEIEEQEDPVICWGEESL